MHVKKSYGIVLVLLSSLILSACAGSDKTSGDDKKGKKPKFMSIVTGGTGGTYYPLGGAFAKILKDEMGTEVSALSSGASAENMETLKAGEAEIAFTQTDIAAYATEGKMMFKDKKIDSISAIGSLYPETIQIVTTADSGINSVEDLKGKTVSVGAPGSGTYLNTEQILEVHGMTMKDIKQQNLSFDESTGGIQDGTIDAAFITAGTPTGAVEGLSAAKQVNIIPIAEDKIKDLTDKYSYYAPDEIPAGTYKMKDPVQTVAVQAMLVVSKDLSNDTVYSITKALFENMDKVGHAKAKLIKAENALKGVGIAVHPGAKKYFDEKGIKE